MELTAFELAKLGSLFSNKNFLAFTLDGKSPLHLYQKHIELWIYNQTIFDRISKNDPISLRLTKEANSLDKIIKLLGKFIYPDEKGWAYQLQTSATGDPSSIFVEIIKTYEVEAYALESGMYKNSFKPVKESDREEIEGILKIYDVKFELIPPEYFQAYLTAKSCR